MKELATATKLDGVIFYGRKGWEKVFTDLDTVRIMMIDEIGEAA